MIKLIGLHTKNKRHGRIANWLSVENGNILTILTTYPEVIVSVRLESSVIKQYYLKDMVSVIPYLNEELVDIYIDRFSGTIAELPFMDFANPRTIKYGKLKESGLSAQRSFAGNSRLGETIRSYVPDIEILTNGNIHHNAIHMERSLLFLVNDQIFFQKHISGRVFLCDVENAIDKQQQAHIAILDFSAVNGFTISRLTNTNSYIFAVKESYITVHMANSANGTNSQVAILFGRIYFGYQFYRIDNDTLAIEIPFSLVTEYLTSLNFLPNWIRKHPNSNEYDFSNMDMISALSATTSGIININAELFIESNKLASSGISNTYSLINSTFTNGIALKDNGRLTDYVILNDGQLVISDSNNTHVSYNQLYALR